MSSSLLLRVGLAVVIVAAVPLLDPAVASAQCAMCRTAFDSPEGRQMIAAYRRGVLFLLAVPFITFGTIAYLAIRGQRRAQGGGETAPPSGARGGTRHEAS